MTKTKELKSELLYYLFDFLDYDEDELHNLYKYIRGTKNVKGLKKIMRSEIEFMLSSNNGVMYNIEYDLINKYKLFNIKNWVIKEFLDEETKWEEWEL